MLVRSPLPKPPAGPSIGSVTSFGEDARGELYVVDQGGEVLKAVPGW